jgi:hypothetical protein
MYRGCYVDNSKKRLLTGFKYDLPEKNSPERCIQHCLRIGFQLAGKLFTDNFYWFEKKVLSFCFDSSFESQFFSENFDPQFSI